jgi:hypothetical protein
MSEVLQPVAEHNPVTYWCNLARYLSIGPAAVTDPAGNLTYTLEELIVRSVLWIVVLLGIFIPLSIRLYRKLT